MTPRRAPWAWGRPERNRRGRASGKPAPGTTRNPRSAAGGTPAPSGARHPAAEASSPPVEGSPAPGAGAPSSARSPDGPADRAPASPPAGGPADAAPAGTPAAGDPVAPDEAPGPRAAGDGAVAATGGAPVPTAVRNPATEADEPSAARRTHADYTGGVYGSMLAASVIVGAGTLGAFPRLELMLLLLLTGVVFWIAHVHAQLFGARLARHPPDRAVVGRVCREEWTIVKAAVPPALAVGVGPVLGLDVQGGQWFALSVAVTGQVGWSVAAARQAGAPGRLLVLSALVNLALGLVILASKLWLKH